MAVVLALAAAPAVAQESLTWAGGVAGGGWDTISNGMAELIRGDAGPDLRLQETSHAFRSLRRGNAKTQARPPLSERAPDRLGLGLAGHASDLFGEPFDFRVLDVQGHRPMGVRIL